MVLSPFEKRKCRHKLRIQNKAGLDVYPAQKSKSFLFLGKQKDTLKLSAAF